MADGWPTRPVPTWAPGPKPTSTNARSARVCCNTQRMHLRRQCLSCTSSLEHREAPRPHAPQPPPATNGSGPGPTGCVSRTAGL
jgi:hypothetical protein